MEKNNKRPNSKADDNHQRSLGNWLTKQLKYFQNKESYFKILENETELNEEEIEKNNINKKITEDFNNFLDKYKVIFKQRK